MYMRRNSSILGGHRKRGIRRLNTSSKTKKELLEELETLRRENELYRRFAANSRDMLYRMSLPDGRYEFISNASEIIFGHAPRELYENPSLINNLIHPDFHGYFAEQWEKLIAGDMPPFYEYQIVAKNGETKWINQRNVLVLNDDGLPCAIEGVCTDITTNKLKELSLRENEAQLNSLYRASPVSVGVLRDRKIIMVNDRFLRMSGYSRDELIGTSTRIFYENEDTYETAGREIYAELMEKGESSTETTLIMKNGSIRKVQMHFSPLNSGNIEEGITFAVMDVTEQKEMEEALRASEARMQTVFRTAPIGIGISGDHVFKAVNDHFCEMLGYTRKELLGKKSRILCKNDEDFEWLKREKDAELESNGYVTFEMDNLRKDGTVIRVLLSMSYLDQNDPPDNYIFTVLDITDRKNTEQALRASEAQVKSIFRSVPVGIGVANGRTFTMVNDKACEITGYTKDEIVGSNSRMFYKSDEDYDGVMRHYAASMKHGSTSYEIELVKKDGTLFDSLMNLTPINANDLAEGTIFTMMDITERNKTARALKDSEERLQSVFSATPVGIGILIDRKTTMVNEMVAEILGYSRDEVVGRETRVFYKNEEDFRKAVKYYELLQHQRIVNFELELVKKDGAIITAHMSMALITPDNPSNGAIYTMMDISEHKQIERSLRDSEAHLKSIFSASPVGIGVVADRVFKMVNEYFCEMLGYTKEEMLGKETRFIYPDEEEFRFVGSRYPIMEKEGKATYENAFLRKDGVVIHALMSIVPIDPDNSSEGVTFTALDITERKRMIDELTASEAKFKSLYESMLEGLALHDIVFDESGEMIDYHILDVNTSFERIIGMKKEDVVGKLGTEVYGVEKAPFLDVFGTVAQTGKPHIFEIFYQPLDKYLSISVFSPGKDQFATVFSDITERKRMEDDLKKSERDLKEAQRIAKIGNWTWGDTPDVLNWSDEIYALYDIDKYKTFEEKMHELKKRIVPEDYDEVIREINDFKNNSEKEIRQEYRIRTRDGELKYLRGHVVRQYDADGNNTGAAGTLQDITEQKLYEKEIEQMNLRFQEAVNAGNIGWWEWNLETDSHYYSPEWRAQLGIHDDNIGDKTEIWLSRLHPDDKIIVEKAMQQFISGKTDHAGNDLRYWHEDGSYHWMHVQATVYRDETGKAVRLVGANIDVTERRATEDLIQEMNLRFQQAVKGGSVGLWDWNLLTNEVYYSPEWKSMLGYSEDDIKPHFSEWERLVHPDDIEFAVETESHFIEHPDLPFQVEFRMLHKDGSWRWIQSKATVITDEQGKSVRAVGTHFDITALKEAVEALKVSEERFDEAIRATNDGIYDWNLLTNEVYYSPIWKEMIGYSDDELENSIDTWERLTEPEGCAIAKQRVQDVIAGKTDHLEAEFKMRHKDGHWVDILTRGTVHFNDEGTAVRMIGTNLDITKLREAEAARRENESLFKALFETSSDALYLTSADTVFVNANQAAIDMLGWTLEELKGMRVEDIDPTITEEMRTEYREYWKNNDNNTPLKSETMHQRKDRTLVPVELIGSRIFVNGEVYYYSIVRDISERKAAEAAIRESENRYRSFIETTSDAVYLLSVENEIVEVNPAASDMLGWSAEELVGQPVEFIVPDFDLNKNQAYWDNMPDNARFFAESEHRRKDGRMVPVEVVVSRFFANGKEYRYAMARDVSERKKAEKKQVELEEQLHQSQKMEAVGRLAGGVAHDFNNMLNVILLQAEVAALEEELSPPLKEAMQEITDAASRSADLTRQLLAFARKQAFKPRVIDINETIESMLKMLQRLIGEDIDLRWLPGEDIWKVKLDPSQVDQILANLCVNARDAINGVGKVTIETENSIFDESYCDDHAECIPGEYVMLAVSDTGLGMDAETKEKIFEPFFTTKGLGEGTGLGLSTVYGIIKQNDGFINVYSEPGHGTTFKIYIKHQESEIVVRSASAVSGETATGTETVLLVEDDAANLKVTSRILSHAGYKVYAALTPEKALELAEKYKEEISLVISDVILPEMNGKDLTQLIKKICPDSKILFISGYTANVIEHHGVLEDGVDFIQKPYTYNDITMKCREVLDR